MRSFTNTVRILSIVVALTTSSRMNRTALAQAIDGYDQMSEDVWKRRMYDDLRVLQDGGFSVSAVDVAPLRLVWPQAVSLSSDESSRLIDAAVAVGEGYFLELPLRLAIYKLTGQLLPVIAGEPTATVSSGEVSFAGAALRSAITGRCVYARGSREELAIHGVLIDQGRVHAVVAGTRGRAGCRLLSELRPSVGKSPGGVFSVRSRIDVSSMAIPRAMVRETANAGSIASEGFSRVWTLAQAIVRGDVRNLKAACVLTGLSNERIALDLRCLNLTSVDAGEYLLFTNVGKQRIAFDTEIHSDLLGRAWPLTPLEAQAVYGVLGLAGDRRLAASVELATGIANRIYVADRQPVGRGLVEVAA